MVEVIQRRQPQPSYSFNQQTFVEVPGTVLRTHPLVKKTGNTLHRVEGDTLNEYRECTTGS